MEDLTKVERNVLGFYAGAEALNMAAPEVEFAKANKTLLKRGYLVSLDDNPEDGEAITDAGREAYTAASSGDAG